MELTKKEREVCDLASRGYSVKYVSARLHLSPRTIETHLLRIYRKHGITKRDELIEHYERGI